MPINCVNPGWTNQKVIEEITITGGSAHTSNTNHFGMVFNRFFTSDVLRLFSFINRICFLPEAKLETHS